LSWLFTVAYTFVAVILHIVATPFLLYYSTKVKYKDSLPARFFLRSNKPLPEDGVWFHVCSFGEVRALAPILSLLPSQSLRITTTTQTGHDQALHYTPNTRYLPFESLLPWWSRRQKVLVVMEAEFWYLMFWIAKLQGAKTLLVNARISDRSYHKYQRMGWFYRRIFASVDEVYAQTEIDKQRLESLGATNISVIGNIKFANIAGPTAELVKPDGLIVCAASTHEGEESLILNAFRELKHKQPHARLFVAPRHPERFAKIHQMLAYFCELQHWSYRKLSNGRSLKGDVVLIDSLGELINLYAISDVVVLGGAFAPVGGHNAAEAAQFGCRIISGEHFFNQRDIFEGIEGIEIVKSDELSEKLQYPKLLSPTKIIRKCDISPIVSSIKRSTLG